ncbi:CHRD domain-containing protein [Nonomuraea fuscirosea]|uniref:CHRD domain-containing protein n=1 Tax=Nonomuraea fuscirosea TaxID=1291556 RepID=UPI002DD98711|nr:CHRD domain-containing protein [Nonomuraea fuscirosea]WSA55773.1 CHRD domain-containing protein [Nonomuraea fuscirosea]
MNKSQSLGKGRAARLRAARSAATAAVLTVAAGAMIAGPASAASRPAHGHTHTSVSTTGSTGAAAPAGFARKYYFAAGLLGRNEVREPGKKVNDRDGVAVAKFRIHGNRFYYFVQWKNTGRPTAFHIHRGKAGVNGPVVIDLLSNGRIRGNTSFGSVNVKSSLLKGIKKNPKNWYANLHTAKFPDGAVRGQLHKGGPW